MECWHFTGTNGNKNRDDLEGFCHANTMLLMLSDCIYAKDPSNCRKLYIDDDDDYYYYHYYYCFLITIIIIITTKKINVVTRDKMNHEEQISLASWISRVAPGKSCQPSSRGRKSLVVVNKSGGSLGGRFPRW